MVGLGGFKEVDAADFNDNWGDYSGCGITNGTVTHWMPIPEIPETLVKAKELK